MSVAKTRKFGGVTYALLTIHPRKPSGSVMRLGNEKIGKYRVVKVKNGYALYVRTYYSDKLHGKF